MPGVWRRAREAGVPRRTPASVCRIARALAISGPRSGASAFRPRPPALEAPARKDAEAALAGLPLAAGGVIVFEFIELHPFGAFEVLFADRLRT